jgi:glycosyltransferase involved in cell wall biosynthesis
MSVAASPQVRRASGQLVAPPVVRLPGTLSLVLPAHNEETNIRPVVERALAVLPEFTDGFEIIVVDDGSRDRTGAIADALALAERRVKVIHHPRNRGYGGALTSGFQAATGDFIMFMDADRQFDIADIALLAPFVGAFDIVAGFRMERRDPLHRRVFAEIFNVTVRLLFGVHLRDIDCAFKVFRGDLLRSIAVTAPGALINTEIQAKARRQGATVEQVGVHHYPRIAGNASGGNWRVIARAMWETVTLWWRLHHYRPPATTGRSRGPYLVGDAIIGGAVVASLSVIVARFRRWAHRQFP